MPPFSPMLVAPGPLPRGPEWVFEPKWDGFRAVAAIAEDGSVRLRSRHGTDLLSCAPELAAPPPVLAGREALLDGELVALRGGVPDFHTLRARLQNGPRRRATVVFVAFDVPRLDGEDLCARPWSQRRAALESLGLGEPGQPWQLTPCGTDGDQLWQTTLAVGMEGVVAKRTGARYRPGVRSGAWRKAKHWRVESFRVIGYRRGAESATLLLAREQNGETRYAGEVETGPARLEALLDGRPTFPSSGSGRVTRVEDGPEVRVRHHQAHADRWVRDPHLVDADAP